MARVEGCREVLLSFCTITFPEGIGWHTQIRQFDGTIIDSVQRWRQDERNPQGIMQIPGAGTAGLLTSLGPEQARVGSSSSPQDREDCVDWPSSGSSGFGCW